MKLYEVDCDCVSSCRMDHGGQQRLRPGVRKCECVLSLIYLFYAKRLVFNCCPSA